MENRGILYVFPVFHSAWMAKKISFPAADDLFRVSLIFREKLLAAVLHDGASGDDADEGVLVVHHRDKVLGAGPADELVHTRMYPHRHIVLPAGDLHNLPGLRLAHIHVAHILQSPEQ